MIAIRAVLVPNPRRAVPSRVPAHTDGPGPLGTTVDLQANEHRARGRCWTLAHEVLGFRKPPVGSSSLPVGSARKPKEFGPVHRASHDKTAFAGAPCGGCGAMRPDSCAGGTVIQLPPAARNLRGMGILTEGGRRLRRAAMLALTVAVVANSCGGAATPARTTASAPAAATTSALTSTAPTSTTAKRAAFVTTPLTDARTGERFTLADFPGKVVLGIAMAVW